MGRDCAIGIFLLSFKESCTECMAGREQRYCILKAVVTDTCKSTVGKYTVCVEDYITRSTVIKSL